MIYIGGFISQYGFIELLFMLLKMDMLLHFQQGDLFLANKSSYMLTNFMLREMNHKLILMLHIVTTTTVPAKIIIFLSFSVL